jgi:molybdate transport system ATP-binding protein
MTITARMCVDLGNLHLDIDLTVEAGEVVALLGPNGAGKTTVLRALAGLQPIDAGRVTIEDRVVDEPAAGLFVPAEQRPVGVVFQDYLLFPHLTVRENVAFGPRAKGAAKAEARAGAQRWLDRVGIADLGGQRPRKISGGQAQRAALARALATEPRLLLFDEPLAALDAGTRTSVRRDLHRHLAEFDGATVLVTHDALDAIALADRIVILETGTVTQTGSLAEVMTRPRSSYVADLIGMNLLRGRSNGTLIDLDDHLGQVVTADPFDGPVLALIHPNAVSLHRNEPEGSPRNRWHEHITGFDLLGDRVRVRLDGEVPLVAEVTPAAVAEMAVTEGDTVWASVKATEITAYPS